MGTTNCKNELDEIDGIAIDIAMADRVFRRTAVTLPDQGELADTDPAPPGVSTLPSGSMPGAPDLPKGFTGTAPIPFAGVDGFDELRESDT